MANAIDNPYGYLVTPEDGLGIQMIQRMAEEDRRRRWAAAANGVPGMIVTSPNARATGSTMINRNMPPVTYSPPVPNPPEFQAAVAPAPEFTGEWQGPPAPPAPQDIDLGIPIEGSPTVYSRNLPALPASATAPRSPMRFGFSAGAPTWTPVAPPPSSRKFDKPEFIYTNPVAAQQAAAQYNARLSTEAAQDASYRDYLTRLNAERNANERSAQQTQFSRDALAAQQAESAANRASAENIARTSELVRAQRQAEADFQANNRLWEIADGMATQLNRDPANVDMKGIDRRLVTWDARLNKWVPSVGRPTAPVRPQTAPPAVPSPMSSGYPTQSVVSPDGFMSTDFAPRQSFAVPSS